MKNKILTLLVILLVVSLPISFLIGRFVQDRIDYRSQYENEKAIMEKIIQEMNLKNVEIVPISSGGVSIKGVLANKEEKEKLIKKFFDKVNSRQMFHFNEGMNIKLKTETGQESGE